MASHSHSGRVLVYGGRGALGSVIVNFFKTRNYWVGSLDLTANDAADVNVLVRATDSWVEQETQVSADVARLLGDNKLDAILCVAGGWAGGNAASADVVKNAELMWKQSVWSSLIAATLASKHLKEQGLLQLTGAQPSLGATPGMMGYGMAKAAVHQLTKSLAANKSGLPSGCHVLTILPVTLDTPMNRKFMPKSDFTSWTPLEYVANMLYTWTCDMGRHPSGSLLQMNTKDGETTVVAATSDL